MSQTFAKPYVDALFEVAPSLDAVESLLPALEEVAAALEASEELRAVLKNPGVPRERKQALVVELSARSGAGSLGQRLLLVLLSQGRLPALREVVTGVRRRLDQARNVVEASVTSAGPLAPEARAALTGALEKATGKTVRLDGRVDPALLAGFVVQVVSAVFDASLSRRLSRARTTLEKAVEAARP